jgi:probable rRNA maturation factor
MPKTLYKINVQIDEIFAGDVEPRRVREAARVALTEQAAPRPGELTIAITDDDALQRLNRQFLGHDQPTDVLSFPAEETEQTPHYFGDVVISFPRAYAQAEAGRHPVEAEIQLLIVHGVLHLLGHDHARPQEKARMWAAQAEILRQLKSPITGPVEG